MSDQTEQIAETANCSEASGDVVEQLNRIADYVAETAPSYAKAIRRAALTPAPQADALLREESRSVGFGNVRDILKGRRKLEPGMHAYSYLCDLIARIDTLTESQTDAGAAQ